MRKLRPLRNFARRKVAGPCKIFLRNLSVLQEAQSLSPEGTPIVWERLRGGERGGVKRLDRQNLMGERLRNLG